MTDPLPRGNTENQRASSDAGDSAGSSVVSTARDGLNAVRNGISSVWNSVTGNGTPAASSGTAGSTGATAESGSDDNEDTDPNTPGVQRRSSFRWGNMVGGLLGAAGAWMIGQIFGGGWLGTIMSALFAIPGFMLGRSQLGGWLSGLFGEQPSPAAGRSPEVAAPGQAQAQAQGQTQTQAQGQTQTQGQAQAQTNAQGQPVASTSAAPAAIPQLTPQQQLQQEVIEVAQKSQIAGATIVTLVQSGQMNPRRAQTFMRSLNEIQQMVAGAQTLDFNQLSPEQMNDIHRRFQRAENMLDRAIGQNPVLAAQIQQRIRPVAPVAPVAAPAAAPQDQWYQPANAVPMARPVTAIGSTLDPQAQAQINAMRNQGYAYAPAAEAPTAGPRFDSSTYGMYQYPGSQRVN